MSVSSEFMSLFFNCLSSNVRTIAGSLVPQMLPVTATFAPGTSLLFTHGPPWAQADEDILAFAVYYALLNLRVSMVRVSCNTMMGTDAANKSSKSSQSSSALKPDYSNDLLVSARCHANFVENVPYALLVASFVELNGGNTRFLTASLAALLFFRVAHVEFGLKAKDSMGWGRPVGYFGTLGFVVGMSSYAAWLSPLSPPPYLDCNCEPHKHGMIVKDPPVCSRCADQPESLAKLEQHVRVPRKGSDSVLPPKGLLDGASSRLSLTNPLDPEANRLGNTGVESPLELLCRSKAEHIPRRSPQRLSPPESSMGYLVQNFHVCLGQACRNACPYYRQSQWPRRTLIWSSRFLQDPRTIKNSKLHLRHNQAPRLLSVYARQHPITPIGRNPTRGVVYDAASQPPKR
ncbi:hypothetical protein AYO22_04424 [Fonsecaea multimorphosa]|nr:hypothetical protein AYO22_04424 [Fonsecaea multimorphosa]